jgi:large subunit ribosomal protein L9
LVKPATAANLAEFETIKADLEAKEAVAIKAAQSKADAMVGTVCSLKANASEEGKLFGSVTTVDIKASLAQAGHEVEKCDINLPEAIHHVGEYDISITLHTKFQLKQVDNKKPS